MRAPLLRTLLRRVTPRLSLRPVAPHLSLRPVAPRPAVPCREGRCAALRWKPHRAALTHKPTPCPHAAPRRAAPSPRRAVGVLKGVGPCSECLRRKGMPVSWKQARGRKGCGALAYNMAIYLPSSRPWRIGRLEIMELCSLSTVARPWPARAWH